MGDAEFQAFRGTVKSPALLAVVQHWHQVRGRKRMPNWTDLSSAALTPHFELLWGFQHNPETGDFNGRLAGKHVKDWLGANFWGASLKDLHAPHVFADSHRFLFNVVSTPAAGRCSGRLFTIGGAAVTGERIALPLAADGLTADAVLGASAYETPISPGPVELIHENAEWFAI